MPRDGGHSRIDPPEALEVASAIFEASIHQRKHMSLGFRDTYTCSSYAIFWYTALLYVANAALEDAEDSQWRSYFNLCLTSYAELFGTFRMAEGIVRSLLYIALRKMDSLWQQTQDIRQMQDLNQTPLSTPTDFGMESMCFLPKVHETHHSNMGNHIVASETNQADFAQKHLPTPPPKTCVSLFLPMADQTLASQPSVPASINTPPGGCACFKACSEFNNSLHDTYTRLRESSGGLDASSFNSIMELVYRAMAGCLSVLSCERCTSPIERELAISVSNIISQISRLYEQLVFRFGLPREMVSRSFSRLLAVSEEFAEQCQYLAEDPQSGLDLVGIVTRSIEWFDHMQDLGDLCQSIEDDANKSGNDSDMSFQY